MRGQSARKWEWRNDENGYHRRRKHLPASVLILLMALATLSASPQTQAGTAPQPPLSEQALPKSGLRLGIGASFLRTSTNFNRDGAKAALSGDASFQTAQTSFFFQYGLTEDFTLLTQLPVVFNSATGPTIDSSGTTQGTTTSISGAGAGDAVLGARYQPLRLPLNVIFDLELQLPLYSRAGASQWSTLDASSSVPLGSGATEVSLLGALEFPLNPQTVIGARLGYSSRTGGLSNLFPYGLYLRYEEPRGLLARLGLVGWASVSDDQYGDPAETLIPADRSTAVLGGSAAYNALNPRVTKLALDVGTHLGSAFFVNAGVHYPIAGRNVPAQPLFVAALGFDFGGKLAKDSEYAHSNRGFQEYYLSSKVLRANNQLRQVLIDRGRNDQIRVGELLDIFEPDQKDGTFGDTVARARVLEAGPTRSKLQALEFFKSVKLQEGFVVRRPVR